MNYSSLISRSKAVFLEYAIGLTSPMLTQLFKYGAKWMHLYLHFLNPAKTPTFNANINYTFYGLLKYGTSLLVFFIAAYFLFLINPLLSPLAIIIFYFAEVHFLFLFPLLILNEKKAILRSIQTTYRLGILKLSFLVLQIGIFMILGFFNFKAPLNKWKIGCIAIIILFDDEVRNRL